ncbi:MAG: multidrug ABC transporter ATP-binding protein, partial [Planctomycetes bacterium]|nr:multidrug ABC transporter ATP-binding protein [Planctomycetota bacterium]
ELLKDLRRMGKTIVISSHILHELAELCTTIGIIEQGELLFHGSLEEAVRRARMGTRVHIRVLEQQDLAAQLLEKQESVKKIEINNGYIVAELDDDVHDFSPLAQLLLANKFRINEIKEEEVNLETAFMRLTKGIVQ